MKQAHSDNVTLLKDPPSSAYPTLTTGDSTYSALIELAILLKRHAHFHSTTTTSVADSSTSLPSSTTYSSSMIPVPLPRVTPSPPTSPTTVSLPRVQLSPKTKFPNSLNPPSTHLYNLLSSTTGTPFKHLASRFLLAQHFSLIV